MTKPDEKPTVASPIEPVVRRFIVTEAKVGNFSTRFTVSSFDENNNLNEIGLSSEALIHEIGKLAGKRLGEIKGLKFTVTITA